MFIINFKTCVRLLSVKTLYKIVDKCVKSCGSQKQFTVSLERIHKKESFLLTVSIV